MAAPRGVQAQLTHAYAECRAIARSAARNFYYGFLALPSEKRNALCAVYAFMRRADDICDLDSAPPEERLARLEDWLGQAKAVMAGQPTDDPVLMALADARTRFDIPVELFEQLAHGTAMDLHLAAHAQPSEALGSAFQNPAFQTFDQLYQYCYHVASVVGLVCVRVFGARDLRAGKLAEQCGVAFQLTNILRDLREDAAIGRIYLPQEDFDRFSVAPSAVAQAAADPGALRALVPLLEFEAQRAREFYRSGRALIPLVEEDSRGALWVLIEIYSRLLERIAARGYDVFHERISLPAQEKVWLLVRGWWRRVTA